MPFRDVFLRACRRERVPHVPVWYMRQAGRYQPEYMEVRKQYSLLEICAIPEICAQVTRLPVEQLGVDAAILFSDIMVPLGPMGISFHIEKDLGPVIANPLRTASDIEALRPLSPPDDLPHVLDTIRLLKDSLEVPLIGFTGGPFTLASYMIEGGPSREYLRTKALMYGEPARWHRLMGKLADMAVVYLRAQIEAGAGAVQVFDSWVGSLAPEDFATYVKPSLRRIFDGLAGLGAPRIYFGVGTGELLRSWRDIGADVIGVDWRVPIREARARLGDGLAVQGNLDPAVLLGPWDEMERRACDILTQGADTPGHIFNLGHGVPRTACVETLRRLTERVHAFSL